MSDRGEYATLYVALLNDEDYQALSLDAQHLFTVLKLLLGASGLGVLHGSEYALADVTPLEPAQVSEAITELIGGGWLEQERNVFWIRNGLRFNPSLNLNNPHHRKKIDRHVAGLPRLSIVRRFCEAYSAAIPQGLADTPIEPIADPIPDTIDDTIGDTIADPVTVDGNGNGSGTSTSARADTDALFGRLWAVHPRGSKKDARKHLTAALKAKDPEIPKRIEDGLRSYVSREIQPDFKGVHLFRWLRDARWEEQEATPDVVDGEEPYWVNTTVNGVRYGPDGLPVGASSEDFE